MHLRHCTVRLYAGLFVCVLLAALLQNGTTYLWLLIASLLLTGILITGVIRKRTVRWSALHTCTLIALIVFALSMQWSVHPNLSFVTFWKLSLGLLAFLIFANCSPKVWEALARIIIITGLIAALWGVIQYVVAVSRVGGPQIDPNAFAAIVYMGSLLWLSRTTLTDSNWRWWEVVGQFVLLFALMATFSRGGVATWAVGVVGLLVLSFTLKRSYTPIYYYLLIALFAYLAVKLLPLVMGEAVISRHFEDISSLNGRLTLFQAAWTLFLESPWVGTGLGTFSVLYPAIRTEYLTAGQLVHNDYLQLLHEGGVVVFGLFMLWLFWHVMCLYKVWQNRHSKCCRQHWELGSLAVLNLLLFTQALINFIFYIEYLNILCGLIFARMTWLALRLGYLRKPKKVALSLISRAGVVIVVSVLWVKLLVIGAPQLLYIEWKDDKVGNSVIMSPEVTELLLTVDPLNPVASEALIQSVYSSLPFLSPEKRQSVFDTAWHQASLLKEKQPAVPKAYYWLGILVRSAEALELQLPSDALHAKDYQEKALTKHPGYFPAHIEIALMLEKTKDAKAAFDYLAPVYWRWYRITSVQTTYSLLGIMVRLAEASKAKELEQFKAMRQQLYHWINNPEPLRPRYEG